MLHIFETINFNFRHEISPFAEDGTDTFPCLSHAYTILQLLTFKSVRVYDFFSYSIYCIEQ